MRTDLELLFLFELRFLVQAALLRGEQLTLLAEDWRGAEEKSYASLTDYRTLSEETWEEREERQHRFNAAVVKKINLQGPLFTEVDAFLGLWGRISLILFPQQEARNATRADRANQLRNVLRIPDDHLLGDRDLRNKWYHFDEIIEGLHLPEADRMTPQRFTSAERLSLRDLETTIRIFVVDTLQIIYAGVGTFEIRAMMDALKDLETSVDRAIDSWGERWIKENPPEDA